ncbi:TIGR03960 family B12-binding radical SAM protein [Caloranaerobacter azorensis]|uniref:TIGR03960 family B12-binding radical SAM protein n=1 Tax=Caloranaerobacter azorensis TaxID=116090 RepID=A0A6P1YDS3_9FIRM|nr:TIGR03960 family B12-binding radical SAM protein [Caloranaerobacter azorensis]QIB26275.1 TIGR03960 family B12-binding radical SAM protein [Caloranaerobacter azorensis]
MINKDTLDKILSRVEKPARYIGNEINSYSKDTKDVKVRFAFAFPDIYEVGMSHLGLHILYSLLNEREDVFCERVFAPWVDMEYELRKHNIPLYALESKEPINKFDFVGFTLQYEMSYTNVLNMLDLAHIPLLSKDRKEEDPFIVAGGPCVYNPEPLADIIDFFVIGESEELILEIIEVYKKWKESNRTREEFLEEISQIQGVYVPKFYEVIYNQDGTIKEFKPKSEKYPSVIKKRIIKNLDEAHFPDRVIVPYIETVHDRVMLEIFRGCTRGCRFCQAGMIYRPVRERSVDKLLDYAQKLVETTGHEEISLSSLSTSDYSRLEELVKSLINKFKDKRIGLSLPSLRLDSFSLDIIQEIQKVRKTGLTFAPEAGSQRLRDIINKGINEEDLINSVRDAFYLGWSTVKLYFMIGLPYENYDDILGIKDLAYKVKDIYFGLPKDKRKGNLKVTVSTSCFVPKPFTPFQWFGQNTVETFKEKQRFLANNIRDKKITYNFHDSELSFLEAVFARGDRRLSKALIRAWQKGCKFDGWADHFNYEKWMETFRETGIDPSFYANRHREYNEILPWDFIDVGVSKKYLINENEKAKKGILTRDCRKGCTGCGINISFTGGVC